MSRYNIGTLAEFYKGKRIAIIGNGPSVVNTDQGGKRMSVSDFSKYPHPIWSVNGGWHYHPTTALGFQMDDVKGVSISHHPSPQWYVSLVKNAKIPIITAKAYDDYPATLAYPLKEIISFFGVAYFTDSLAYMTALAIAWGVEEIDYFGADYITAPPHERAGTEYWCGVARTFGIKLNVPPISNLLKPFTGESYYMPGFYGYSKESFPLEWELAPNNTINIRLSGALASPELGRKMWAMMPNPFFPKEKEEAA